MRCKTIDDFAAAHDGNAPVLVFVDSGGAFNNDTECVNGRRGNAADHLTKDVVPFMVSKFGVSAERGQLGHRRLVDGRHLRGRPDRHASQTCSARSSTSPATSTPTRATRQQTIARLFGGNADAWAAFDPTTVITRHGPYIGVAGWFAIPSRAPAHRDLPIADTPTMRLAGRDAAANPGNQTAAANALCALGRPYGIDCAVVPQPGKHDWPFAEQVFAAALPWLAGRLGTPGVPRIPLPGNTTPPAPAGPSNAQVVAGGR